MKIQIEFICSTTAQVLIDGKGFMLVYSAKTGGWNYATKPPANTVGSLVASKLMSSVIDILQAHMPDELKEDNSPYGTWDILPEHICEQVEERME